MQDLRALRWHMFSIQQLESQKLPATSEAFRQKVIRAHYTAFQGKLSHLPSPLLPDQNHFGWKWNSSNSLYEALTTMLQHQIQ